MEIRRKDLIIFRTKSKELTTAVNEKKMNVVETVGIWATQQKKLECDCDDGIEDAGEIAMVGGKPKVKWRRKERTVCFAMRQKYHI